MSEILVCFDSESADCPRLRIRHRERAATSVIRTNLLWKAWTTNRQNGVRNTGQTAIYSRNTRRAGYFEPVCPTRPERVRSRAGCCHLSFSTSHRCPATFRQSRTPRRFSMAHSARSFRPGDLLRGRSCLREGLAPLGVSPSRRAAQVLPLVLRVNPVRRAEHGSEEPSSRVAPFLRRVRQAPASSASRFVALPRHVQASRTTSAMKAPKEHPTKPPDRVSDDFNIRADRAGWKLEGERSP